MTDTINVDYEAVARQLNSLPPSYRVGVDRRTGVVGQELITSDMALRPDKDTLIVGTRWETQRRFTADEVQSMFEGRHREWLDERGLLS